MAKELNWFEKYQQGQKDKYKIKWLEPKAHENIDNEILANTLNRIKQASSGNYLEALYEAQTKGGDKRYIHETANLLGTPENFGWLDDMIRLAIKQKPQYSDTLAASSVPEVTERMLEVERPSSLQRLFDKIKDLF